jgi:hypothetical protein
LKNDAAGAAALLGFVSKLSKTHLSPQCQCPISPDRVFDASLVPETCPSRFVDSVPGNRSDPGASQDSLKRKDLREQAFTGVFARFQWNEGSDCGGLQRKNGSRRGFKVVKKS